ncbi:FMN-binding negative transcriptional regulator [soil metagenome]
MRKPAAGNHKRVLFEPRSPDELRRLVRDFPLAWVISLAENDFCSTLLPIRPCSGSGPLSCLIGHFARSNRHVDVLKHDPRAWLLFLGPNGYISPSWMSDRTQAPTWNYASAGFRVDIEFFDDAPSLEAHLRDLVQAMETGPDRWHVEEMGERYARLAAKIIGFRAWVRDTRARFKLGQDERDETFPEIVKGLERRGEITLAEWMKRANPGRTPED